MTPRLLLLTFALIISANACKSLQEMRCRQCREDYNQCQVQLKSMTSDSKEYKDKQGTCEWIAGSCSDCNVKETLKTEIPKKEPAADKKKLTPEPEIKATDPYSLENIKKVLAQGRWVWDGYFGIKFDVNSGECQFFHHGKPTTKSECSLLEEGPKKFIKFANITTRILRISESQLLLQNPDGKKLVYINEKE